MSWMNEFEIERKRDQYADHPILGPATRTLHNLMAWTNGHSDGWPYWAVPTVAAERLMEMIERDGTSRYELDDVREDVTEEEYRLALRPIKKFRKKRNADFEIVEIGTGEDDEPEPTLADTSAVEVRYDRGRYYPTVNIKVHEVRSDMERLLPLELGGVSEPGDDEVTTVYTPEGFTFDWIDTNVPEPAQAAWWEAACRDGFEEAKELAKETFGGHVKVYGEGRSGGWLVVHGLPDPVEEWDPTLVAKWVEFAKQVRALADDTPRRFLWLLHANVYEPWEEAQDSETDYVLTITTTNPDLTARVARAFDMAGLDMSNAGALHQLSARLMRGDELLWFREFEPSAGDPQAEASHG